MTDIAGVPSAESLPHAPVAQRDVVVVGASAGGVEALSALVEGLPAELPVAMFVVLHVSPGGTSVLPEILARRTEMHVAAARDGEPIERGRIYVAPPDHHLLLEHDRVRLTHGPRENGVRPAIDPLFRSAARTFGSRVIGVVLSGALDDGTAGLKMVTDRGGVGIVQDPSDALYPSMPQHALEFDSPRPVPIAEMPAALCAMIEDQLSEDPEVTLPDGDPGALSMAERSDGDNPRNGDLTALTCPECGGALWEHNDGGLVRYKCHVGHAYSPETLDDSQSQGLEMALWAALRSLQERADLFRRLARRSGPGSRFDEKARAADEHAAALRKVITSFGREPGEAGEAS